LQSGLADSTEEALFAQSAHQQQALNHEAQDNERHDQPKHRIDKQNQDQSKDHSNQDTAHEVIHHGFGLVEIVYHHGRSWLVQTPSAVWLANDHKGPRLDVNEVTTPAVA
jgi:hypothetical protein